MSDSKQTPKATENYKNLQNCLEINHIAAPLTVNFAVNNSLVSNDSSERDNLVSFKVHGV